MGAVVDWRYWITYEGVVSADTESRAAQAAMDDVENGKIPEVEVEPLDEGREGE